VKGSICVVIIVSVATSRLVQAKMHELIIKFVKSGNVISNEDGHAEVSRPR